MEEGILGVEEVTKSEILGGIRLQQEGIILTKEALNIQDQCLAKVEATLASTLLEVPDLYWGLIFPPWSNLYPYLQ